VSGTEIRENLRRDLGNDWVFECNNSRRPFLHCRHFANMGAGAATGDPPTIHDHIKSSSQYEVYVIVFGSSGDQRSTGRYREGFGSPVDDYRRRASEPREPLRRGTYPFLL
jgi:hypothetical protein